MMEYEKVCFNIPKNLAIELQKEVDNSDDFGMTKSMLIRKILNEHFKKKKEEK